VKVNDRKRAYSAIDKNEKVPALIQYHLKVLQNMTSILFRSKYSAIILLGLVCSASLSYGDSHTSVDLGTGEILVSFPKNTLTELEFIADDEKGKNDFYKLTNDAIAPYLNLLELYPQFMNNVFDQPDVFYPVKLVIDEKTTDWESTMVNASASQTPGKKGDVFATWQISMKGGLYRRPELTKDGFTLIVCHEIGHHFSGYFHYEGFGGIALGLSAEGQADYFATSSCLKRLWKNDDNLPPYEGAFGRDLTVHDLPSSIILNCNNSWLKKSEQLLCYRIAAASISVGTLWGAMDKNRGHCETDDFPFPCTPSVDTPDQSTTHQTYTNHPLAQCRLDTYLAGALCPIEYGPIKDMKLIAGRIDHVPENSTQAELEAFARSCAKPISSSTSSLNVLTHSRPACWFSGLVQ